MTAAWRRRRDSDYAAAGIHRCICGAGSDNQDHWVAGDLLTNSLCVHYLALHRDQIPEEELDKVRALPFAGEEPTINELRDIKAIEHAAELDRQRRRRLPG